MNGLLRVYSRLFPGPSQLAFVVGLVALAGCIGLTIQNGSLPTVLLVPAGFFGIAWVKFHDGR